MKDRMFHVLVLGGAALVGCGGEAAVSSGEAGDAMPDTGPTRAGFPSETAATGGGATFDGSGSSALDAAGAVSDATSDARFPSELPPPPPLLSDAAAVSDAGSGEGDTYADARIYDPCGQVPCELPQ